MAEISSSGAMTHMNAKPLFLTIVMILFMVFHPVHDSVRAQDADGPRAFLPETRFEFPAVFEGQEVDHAFVIRNRGDVFLEILDVRTD